VPIYEYECGDCGQKFEKLVRHAGADTPVTCPDCRSERVQKKMSVCGFLHAGAAKSGADLSPATNCQPSGGG
jgi:putative FmdB family regulatory protein